MWLTYHKADMSAHFGFSILIPQLSCRHVPKILLVCAVFDPATCIKNLIHTKREGGAEGGREIE